MTDGKITHKQLMATVFISLLSPMIRSVPNGEIPLAGKAAWLAPLAGFIPLAVLYGILRLFLKRRTEEIGLGDVTLRAFGPVFGRAFNLIFALWLAFYTGLVLRTAGERLVSYVYNDWGWVVFAAVILLSSWTVALGRLKTLAGAARIFLPVAAAVLFAVLLFLTDDVEAGNLLPVTRFDIPGVLLGGLHLAATLSPLGFFAFLYGDVDKNRAKGGFLYLIALVLVTVAVSVSVIGVLSHSIAATMQSPFFVVIRNIRFLNILERVEAVVIALWVVSDFIYVSALLAVSSRMTGPVFGGKGPVIRITGAAVLAMASSFLCARSAFGLKDLVLNAAPMVNAAAVFILIPAAILTAGLRHKL